MRYDEIRKEFVVDDYGVLPVMRYGNDEYTYPIYDGAMSGKVQHTRQAVVAYENRWSLSIIWGDMTYSSNHNTLISYRDDLTEFTEEPGTVEVGIFMPHPRTVEGVGMLRSFETNLWGDPVGYVDAGALWFMHHTVMRFDSEDRRVPAEGPYLSAIEDVYVMYYTDREGGEVVCGASETSRRKE